MRQRSGLDRVLLLLISTSPRPEGIRLRHELDSAHYPFLTQLKLERATISDPSVSYIDSLKLSFNHVSSKVL